MNKISIAIPQKEISAFCKRWNIVEFALFGSVLSDEFNPGSDVDVLVTFAKDQEISLFDLAQMQIELQGVFQHPVDILEKDALRNPFRKRHILSTAQVVYVC